MMPGPVSVTRDGHRTYLKWHRARRRAGDPAFTGRRILEGMALGASVEVDLAVHAESGFAVLHDMTLDAATTGKGPVRAASAAELHALRLRDPDGRPIEDRVMLLEDLVALLEGGALHPEALLQLDYKEDNPPLTPGALAGFARIVAPVAGQMILSSGDAEAVRRLAAATPGLLIGYDPCHAGAIERLRASRDYPAFVADALAALPAAMIYLDHALVLFADDDGFDLVATFHAAGRRVDAYTIRGADLAGLAAARRLLAARVDPITTDDPAGLAAALA
jgi:glycerophosphoryl diester phosphodiesterase